MSRKKPPFKATKRVTQSAESETLESDPDQLDKLNAVKDDKGEVIAIEKEDRVINIRTGKISNLREKKQKGGKLQSPKNNDKSKQRTGTKSPKKKSKSPKRRR